MDLAQLADYTLEDLQCSETLEKLSTSQIMELYSNYSVFVEETIDEIYARMRYQDPDQESQKIWMGDYCGRCNAKSRSYEGGSCGCNDLIDDLQCRLEVVKDEMIARITTVTPKEETVARMKTIFKNSEKAQEVSFKHFV